jgi:hypothetical protein
VLLLAHLLCAILPFQAGVLWKDIITVDLFLYATSICSLLFCFLPCSVGAVKFLFHLLRPTFPSTFGAGAFHRSPSCSSFCMQALLFNEIYEIDRYIFTVFTKQYTNKFCHVSVTIVFIIVAAGTEQSRLASSTVRRPLETGFSLCANVCRYPSGG